jgi:translocation and assembly module TamB
VLALVGLLPLLLAIVVRTPAVRARGVELVSAVLREELGLEARFSLEIELLPPAVVLTGLTLPASDGGGPAVQVERARVAPRLFSLIAGQLDAGDIELERPRVRLVIEHGAPANLSLRLPKSSEKEPSGPPSRLPFRSLAVSQASVDLDLRDAGTQLRLDEIDLDIAAGEGMVIDGRLQVGRGAVRRRREGAVDDDTLCGLELRAHLGEGALLIRKLGLEARLDEDPAEGAGPSCEGEGPREQRLGVHLSSLRVAEGPELLPLLRGRVAFDLPLRVIRRFVPSAPQIEGSAGLDVDLSFGGKKELPTLEGRLHASEVRLFGERMVAHALDAKIEATPTEVRLPEALASYGDGDVTLRGVRARPFVEGIPIEVPEVDIRGLQFPGLLRDMGVTPHTVVAWNLEHATIKNFHGHVLDDATGKGPSFISEISAQTRDFELTDLGFDDPHRRRVVGTRQASVRGKFGIEPYGAIFRQMSADFGRSHLDVPAVTIGFDEILEVRIGEGTHLELGEISPLLTLPMAGRLELKGAVGGGQSHPRIDGELRATNLRIADLPLADEATARIAFVPFTIDLTKFRAKKGHSSYEGPLIRLDFNRPSGVRVDGNVATKGMDYRDLLSIFQFENDPRLTDVHGTGDAKASLRFEVDGPSDPCRSGAMSVRAQVEMGPSFLYGEFYDGGDAEIDLDWFDRAALERGMEATIRSATLRKGKGIITGAGSVRQGGALRGHFSAQAVPIGRIDAMAAMGVVASPWALSDGKQVVAAPAKKAAAADGTVSASGEIGGTIDAIEARGLISVSPVRIGQRTLPSSSLSLRLDPAPRKEQTGIKKVTRCGNIVPGAFSQKDYERDEIKGVYHVSGKMFGEQLKLDDVQTTWQRSKRVTGVVEARRFDLGSLFQLSPTFAASEHPPAGALSGRLKIERYDLDHPEQAAMTARVDFLEIGQGESRAHLEGKEPVELRIADDRLLLSKLGFGLSVGQDVGADIELGGQISHLTTTRELDLEVRLSPLEIGPFLATVPKIEAAAGKLEGKLSITGRADAPISRGELHLRDGSIQVRGMPVALDNLEVLARVDERELRVVQATAKAGGGSLSMTARAPLNGFEVGEVTARLEASDVHVVLAEGVEMSTGASLTATWSPPGPDGVKHRTAVSGSVNLQSFLYSRPITIAADLDSLARRGKRTEVTVYDPEDDTVDFSINIRAAQPLVFRNNLIEAEVNLDSEALTLSGTNQRFGLRGQLRVGKGGRIWLRSNEFDIRQGTIRFDDPTRIAPRVDLLASTDFRRYTTSSAAGGAAPGGGAAAAPAGGGAGATGHAGGAWRITMHAHGDADNLKLDLASEPDLAQEDIVLLLTIGMTRAELDQLQAANLGSTAALEAFSALSGADRAVKTVLPIIDDFRVGSAYSTRTGRTEPTVTVGKRISDRLRANVITGLSENRDVRSNIEWRLTPTTSILGNYDNLNDVTSQGLGNLGADFRVRLEF